MNVLRLRRITIVVLGLLILVCNGYAQSMTVPVEPSEEWLNKQHKPEKLIELMGLKEGMTIADIGAGKGRMTVWFSVKVGETGKVYANDIDKNALNYLENRCKQNNLKNVTTVLGKVENPMLPPGSTDIAFMVSTYHHLDKPVELMRNTIPCLKKGGILVIVERDPVKTSMSEHESTPKDKLIKQLNDAGFELIKVDTLLLERDNIYIFKVK